MLAGTVSGVGAGDLRGVNEFAIDIVAEAALVAAGLTLLDDGVGSSCRRIGHASAKPAANTAPAAINFFVRVTTAE